MTSTSSRIVGSLRPIGAGKGAVRMEDVYATDIDDLWSAVTEPARLARWLAEVEGTPQVGALVQARFTSSWEGPVRVDVCDAPHHLLVTSNPGTDEETVTEAWLSAEGGSTRLIVEERGLPVGVLPDHGAGWQTHVEDLAAYLAGRPTSNWRTRWEALIPAYRELAVDAD